MGAQQSWGHPTGSLPFGLAATGKTWRPVAMKPFGALSTCDPMPALMCRTRCSWAFVTKHNNKNVIARILSTSAHQSPWHGCRCFETGSIGCASGQCSPQRCCAERLQFSTLGSHLQSKEGLHQ